MSLLVRVSDFSGGDAVRRLAAKIDQANGNCSAEAQSSDTETLATVA